MLQYLDEMREGIGHSEDIGIDGRIILKWMLGNRM
jgi:hypothetical protein